MIVCVVGAGAREHAIARSLAKTADVIATPGNPGITGRSPEGYQMRSVETSPMDVDADLYVIGPEVPLVDGLSDRLREDGRLVFGPSRAAAMLEGSKAHMKTVAARAGVPTARFAICTSQSDAEAAFDKFGPPYVVKTDGLAGGKGVLVTTDRHEATADARSKLSGEAFGRAGMKVVIEEGLFGEELSLLVLTDGLRVVALPPARDFKRLRDGDAGANTGGMGAFSPVPGVDANVVSTIMDEIVEPTLSCLRREATPYQGVLYAGCMLTAEGPKLIEFNVRFGDPEAQVVLPRVSSDLGSIAREVAEGRLRSEITTDERVAVCVVLAADGYPMSPRSGDVITGLDRAGEIEGVTVFHGGTVRGPDGTLRTSGGRVLTITALDESVAGARARAYAAVDVIDFSGKHFRTDIAPFDGGAFESRGVG